ncbi:MAG: hypothetical protein LQ348_004382 [Seirophora lacunosa]|nr:MAG: hypothetical protein LQ348_004382 [Seirophora lacunosa]
MPGIEVLPNSTSISAPGWAYVPDNGYDPSKAAIQPSGARKRAARTSAITGGDTTTRQHNATLRHLAELDKDNYRDVQISVPARLKEKTGSKSKITPNVRRILASQKTFANHLADEEAALASQDQQITPAQPRTPAPTLGRKASRVRGASAAVSETPSTDNAQSAMATPAVNPSVFGDSTVEDSGTQDPLLKSYIPETPSEAVMEALLAGPPLSYNAARAYGAEPESAASNAKIPMTKEDALNSTHEEAKISKQVRRPHKSDSRPLALRMTACALSLRMTACALSLRAHSSKLPPAEFISSALLPSALIPPALLL